MDEDTKVCPVCGETIKAVAIKCRFCNSDLTTHAPVQDLDAEKDLFSGHPAIFYSVGQVVPFLIILAVTCAVGYAISAGYIEKSDNNIMYMILFFLGACAVILLRFVLRSRSIHYEITTQRIKLERGLLSKVQESLELFRIDHFELHKPIGQRLLGQASLRLFSSDAELQRFLIYGIPNLEALADTLRNCQLRERTRRGLTTFVKA